MISSDDSCTHLVAGNYDVIVNEPSSLKTILTDFLEHFQELESQLGQDNCSYSRQFRLLKLVSKKLKEDKANLEDGEHEINQRKNRYKDIIPFNHTRVILSGDPQIPGSGYINANYISGPSGSGRAYIACQGPLACTLIDFWNMIWECGVSVIVMACNEMESGKPKCELYWPEQVGATQCYGNLQVTLMKVRQICSDFLIRKFSVKLLQMDHDNLSAFNNNDNDYYDRNSSTQNGDSGPTNSRVSQNDEPAFNTIKNNYTRRQDVISERTICQFHYTTWPDHGAPDSVQPILELVRLVRDVQPAEEKPILVHCSAGCGRTGTICCIDYVWGLLRQGKLDLNFDLCGIISDMRRQRMSMVQTIEQYILCHRAIAALFIEQLKLIDNHTYENLSTVENEEKNLEEEEQDLGPVFI